MKNTKFFLLLFSLLLLASAPACSRKSGCPATESLQPKVTKRGELKKSGGSKTDLFPKKMRKKMR
ncbi:MAG: hypothetical protein IPL65_21760 [Lewinellaceae bacterium]|nr:hypothetical protein [Lewinellaceae bacterium]